MEKATRTIPPITAKRISRTGFMLSSQTSSEKKMNKVSENRRRRGKKGNINNVLD